MLAAFASQHMGHVIRAWRTHPFHGDRPISQERVALWADMTQPQLSRIETRRPLKNLDHLVHWANVLGVPPDRLWFALPGCPPPATLTGATHADTGDNDDGDRVELLSLITDLIESVTATPQADLQSSQPTHSPTLVWAYQQANNPLAAQHVPGDDCDSEGRISEDEGMDRRAMLAGLGGLVASAALPGLPRPHPRHVAPEVAAYFTSQLDSLQQADALAGPHLVLDPATSQYRAINWLLDATTGPLHTELLSTATVYGQFISHLHYDAGNLAAASAWSADALAMAHRANNRQLVSLTLGWKSELYRNAQDGQGAIDFALAALTDTSHLAAKTQAHALVHAGHGYSLVGDRHGTERSLSPVADLVAAADDDWSWGNALHIPSWADAQWARCYLRLGLTTNAIEQLDSILANLPDHYHRDRGIFHAVRARAHLAASEPAAAAADASAAITHLNQTGSARTRHELAELRTQATPWSTTTEGHNLIDLLNTIT